jgi:hypothetical protein
VTFTYLFLTAKSINEVNRLSASATLSEAVKLLGPPDRQIPGSGQNQTFCTWYFFDGETTIVFSDDGQPTGHQWNTVENRMLRRIEGFIRRLLP